MSSSQRPTRNISTSRSKPTHRSAASMQTPHASNRFSGTCCRMPSSSRRTAVRSTYASAESTARRHGGLGLGLSIVKHLVEAHGGTVTVESAGGRPGATFIVRLPIVSIYADEPDTTAASSVTPADTPTIGAASVSLQGVSVLVVDDDADSREIVAASLEQAGAVVMTSASGAQAL